MDDGIDRTIWITRLREKIALFSTLRWEKQSLMLKGVNYTAAARFGYLVIITIPLRSLVPVVDDDESVRESQGAVECLFKPFSATALLQALNLALRVI